MTSELTDLHTTPVRPTAQLYPSSPPHQRQNRSVGGHVYDDTDERSEYNVDSDDEESISDLEDISYHNQITELASAPTLQTYTNTNQLPDSVDDLHDDTQGPHIEQHVPRTRSYRNTMDDARYKKILRMIRNHNTSFKGLIRGVIRTPNRRISRESLGIVLVEEESEFMNKCVVKYLQKFGWRPVNKHLRKELGAFCKAFLQGQDNISLESMSKQSTANSWLSTLMDKNAVTEVAPSWVDLITVTTAVRREGKKREKSRFAWTASVIAQMAFRMQPNQSSRMARNLGMLLHSCNITRRGLEILSSLGVTCSYSTVNRAIKEIMNSHQSLVRTTGQEKQRIVVYDNFNITDRIRDMRVGDETKMWNITTGLLKISDRIPATGIPRSWLNRGYVLSVKDITPISMEQRKANSLLHSQLLNHYIFRAMCICFPSINDHWKTNRDYNHTSHASFSVDLPVIHRPDDIQASKMIPLGPLMFNEATEDGNADILEDIYENQFGINPSDSQFQENIFLHFGDAMTTSRLHTLKHNRSVCESEYASLRWLLPVFGLWHLRLNVQRLILKYHFGGKDDDRSSLWYTWHSAYVSRNFNDKVFDVCDQLITQSFNARIVAISRHNIQSRMGSDVPIRRKTMEDWWTAQDWLVIQSTIEMVKSEMDIYKTTKSRAQDSLVVLGETGLPQPSDNSQTDDEYENHLRFLANALPYMIITDAIRTSDIGLLRYGIRQTLLLFAGSSENHIYSRELCYYYWLTATSASDQRLQEIILFESMVNQQARSDTFYEMDKANELLNLYLRIVKLSRRSSSINVNLLMERYTRIYAYNNYLRDLFDGVLHTGINNQHKTKDLADHVWLLSGNLLESKPGQCPSIVRDTNGRGALCVTPLLINVGKTRLHDVVMRFNKWIKNADTETINEQGQRLADSTIRDAVNVHQTLLARVQRQDEIMSTIDESRTSVDARPVLTGNQYPFLHSTIGSSSSSEVGNIDSDLDNENVYNIITREATAFKYLDEFEQETGNDVDEELGQILREVNDTAYWSSDEADNDDGDHNGDINVDGEEDDECLLDGNPDEESDGDNNTDMDVEDES